jgi:dUTP pyrophosphatase
MPAATGYHHHGGRNGSRYATPDAVPGGGISLPELTRPRVALPPVDGGALEVLVQRLRPEVPLPEYALPGDAGADVVATVDVTLRPGERAVVPTGLAVAIPDGFAAFVHPRSGLAARAGMGLLNAPGTIDSGYRGELKVIVVNHDPVHPLRLERGDRIAQLIFQRVERARFVEVAQLPASARGRGGHGSTGGAAALAGAATHTAEVT